MKATVLLVDDDASVREALGQTLELADIAPILAGSFVAAKDNIARNFEGVIVTDIRMPGRDGFHLLEYARQIDPELPVILLTGEGDIPMAVKGISGGAYDFLEKPCAPKQFITVVENALRQRHEVLAVRAERLRRETGDAASRLLFGASSKAEALRDRVRKVATASAEVLITGEPGTGTSKVAEVIHLLSNRSSDAFVKRPASLMTAPLLLETLEAAKRGTVFLDDIALMPLDGQYALLDHLDAAIGARVLAGSYQDLSAAVEEARLMRDLHMRLEAVSVYIPALRDRHEDIPVLFRHYLAIACEQAALPEPVVDQDVISRLLAQSWPGNARALMNAAMRFAMGMNEFEASDAMGLSDRMAQFERSLIIEALQANGGHATETAQALKLPRKTFYDKLSRHGIRAEDFRRT